MYNHVPIEKVTRRNRFSLKWLLIITLSLVFIIIIGLIGVSVYVGMSMVKTEAKQVNLSPSDYNLDYEEIEFISADEETTLRGWVLEPDNPPEATIIMSHGYKGNRYEENVGFLPLSQHLIAQDYRVIMFDFRNSGESDGDTTTVGVNERYDLLGAVDWTTDKYDEPIILYGISMGASTSIAVASMTENVIAVIADSPFSDLTDYLEVNLPVWTDLPNFPFTPIIMQIIPVLTNVDLSELSPYQALSDIYPRPIFFIHGNSDDSIPHSESERMVDVYPDLFDLWITEDTSHVKSFEDYPEEYAERLLDFIDRALLNTSPEISFRGMYHVNIS